MKLPVVVLLLASLLLPACGTKAVVAPGNSQGSNQAATASNQGNASQANTGQSSQANQTSQTGTSNGSSSNNAANPVIDMSNYKGALPGDVLIADRGNDRLLIVTPSKKIIWSMSFNLPKSKRGAHHSLGADDAFFTPDHKHIIVNEEDYQRIAIIDIKTKKVVWSYGHGGVAGSKPGYLNTPDDAYQLADGTVTVADIVNQRILFIAPDKHIIKQYGITRKRYHNPPKTFAAPNGDTPVKNGTLVTEIGNGHGYADLINNQGKLLFSTNLHLNYPSDTQMLPSGNLEVVNYSIPGKVEEITPQGKVLWLYDVKSGNGELKKPSLGLPLSNGDILINDDYNDRIIVLDPSTNKIVWQYGHTGKPGTKPGYLNTPDGLDVMNPAWPVAKTLHAAAQSK